MKYCDEQVCACVSVCLSVCPRGYLRNNTRDLYQLLMPMAMARSSSVRATKSQGEGTGGFFPIDNALYIISFGTHTKPAEPIDMPFWTKNRVGPRNYVLDEGKDTPTGRAIFRGCSGHSKTLAIFDAALAAAFAAKGIIQSLIASCSRRDHSVCQASAERNPENFGAGDAAYRPGRG